MATRHDYAYRPDYAVLPGDSLQEVLRSLSMSQKDLASRMGRPVKTINEIIKGKAAITADTALQLERVLGVPASFWTNLERNYRQALARKKDERRLKSELAWLKRFPIRAMIKAGWIQAEGDVGQLQEMLRFFGVASPDEWRNLWGSVAVAYRKSAVFASDPGAVAAWLRQGELEAQRIQCELYDPKRFRAALQAIRGLTVQPPEVFQPELRRLCAEAGVALAFVPELPMLRISGAARWLAPRKAMIQLSLRYKADDHLWFSFFHEAGHVLLHGKREVFIDDGKGKDGKEAEANKFAADLLIPPQALRRFVRPSQVNDARIMAFAKQIGIAPGIVVGRLQHDGVFPHDRGNHLKKRFEWARQPAKAAAA